MPKEIFIKREIMHINGINLRKNIFLNKNNIQKKNKSNTSTQNYYEKNLPDLSFTSSYIANRTLVDSRDVLRRIQMLYSNSMEEFFEGQEEYSKAEEELQNVLENGENELIKAEYIIDENGEKHINSIDKYSNRQIRKKTIYYENNKPIAVINYGHNNKFDEYDFEFGLKNLIISKGVQLTDTEDYTTEKRYVYEDGKIKTFEYGILHTDDSYKITSMYKFKKENGNTYVDFIRKITKKDNEPQKEREHYFFQNNVLKSYTKDNRA